MTVEDLISTLPQYAKDYTPEQREACIEWLSRLDLNQLRARQTIMSEQIRVAYLLATKPHPPAWANDTLEDLQEKDQQLIQAINRWLTRHQEREAWAMQERGRIAATLGCPWSEDDGYEGDAAQNEKLRRAFVKKGVAP